MSEIVVYKHRTTTVQVDLGIDVSNDDLTSEIRVDKTTDSELIATWDLAYKTDGIDGKLVLTLDDSVVDEITQASGYMDIKRVVSGEPVNAFDKPVKVVFRDVVTL